MAGVVVDEGVSGLERSPVEVQFGGWRHHSRRSQYGTLGRLRTRAWRMRGRGGDGVGARVSEVVGEKIERHGSSSHRMEIDGSHWRDGDDEWG